MGLTFVALVLVMWCGDEAFAQKRTCLRGVSVPVAVITVYESGEVVVSEERASINVEVPCDPKPPSAGDVEIVEEVPAGTGERVKSRWEPKP